MINNHDIIWLASYEDREGEAIAWHIYNQFKIKFVVLCSMK
ncbi:MAG: hypothetical protein ACFIN3_00355 [Candidatus Walczuchella monophlebidarum]